MSSPFLESEPLHRPDESEYLSTIQLGELGTALSAMQRVDSRVFVGLDLRARQLDNRRAIALVYRSLLKAAEGREIVTPAAEWLLDNFYLIEDTIKQVRRDLPKQFYQKLPDVQTAEGKCVPRMTILTFQYLEHSHCEVTEERLSAMIEGYQQVLPCRIGEL